MARLTLKWIARRIIASGCNSRDLSSCWKTCPYEKFYHILIPKLHPSRATSTAVAVSQSKSKTHSYHTSYLCSNEMCTILLPVPLKWDSRQSMTKALAQKGCCLLKTCSNPRSICGWRLAFMYDELESGMVPPHTTGFVLLCFVKNSFLSTHRPGKHFKACPVHVIVW